MRAGLRTAYALQGVTIHMAESRELVDAAVLDLRAVSELAELVLAAHVVDEPLAKLLGCHLGVGHLSSSA